LLAADGFADILASKEHPALVLGEVEAGQKPFQGLAIDEANARSLDGQSGSAVHGPSIKVLPAETLSDPPSSGGFPHARRAVNGDQ
jgi:hypothetical protein